MAKIELQKVSKCYHNRKRDCMALEGIDVTFEEGSFTAIMGSSGIGKTTVLNLIAGFIKPSSGKILVDGEDITTYSHTQQCLYRKKEIGMIFQSYGLLPFHTVRENILVPCHLLHQSIKETEVQELLETLGITHLQESYPDELSGGEQQRVAIARAFLHHPSIILADEPTGNLDIEHAIAFMELLKELHEVYQPTIILATHDDRIASYSDCIIKLQDL